MGATGVVSIAAEPGPMSLDLARTALIIIDMQRDFLEPGGFGEALGNEVQRLSAAVKPCQAVLERFRRRGLPVIHTREGHRPDLSDAPPAKVERGAPGKRIGDPGPMGRILVRGEAGHDIVPELYPRPGEPVIDKPGKGSFHATDLHAILQNLGRREPHRMRRDHRGVRPHDGARGQRPRATAAWFPATAAPRISRSFTRSGCG